MDLKVGNWLVHLRGDRSLVKSQVSLKSMMKSMGGEDRGFSLSFNILEPITEVTTLILTPREFDSLPIEI